VLWSAHTSDLATWAVRNDRQVYHFVGQPVAVFAMTVAGMEIPTLPEFDMGTLMTVLGGMLGIGGLRTYEKKQGLTK